MSGATIVSYAQAAMGHPSGNKDKEGHQQPTQTKPNATHPGFEPVSQSKDALRSGVDAVKLHDTDSAVTNGHDTYIAGDQEETMVEDGPLSTDASSLDDEASTTSAITGALAQREQRDKKEHQLSSEENVGTDGSVDADLSKDVLGVELSEAPIPTVNIWHQRQEAQLAKAKSSIRPSRNMELDGQSHVAGSKQNFQDTRKNAKPSPDLGSPVPAQAGTTIYGPRPTRKAEVPRNDVDVGRRNSHRGPKITDKDADGQLVASAPPPVDDASMWPTPDTAIKEDKRRTSEREKDKDKEGSEDTAPQKPRSKQWINMDFVPSVVFKSTPVPLMRGSRGRGGARGGVRDTMPRSGHGGTGTTVPTTSGGKPSSTTSAPGMMGTDTDGSVQDREHATPREADDLVAREISTPTTAFSVKRSSADIINTRNVRETRDSRKQGGEISGDRPKDGSVNGLSNQAQQNRGRDRAEGTRSERGRAGTRGRGGQHGVIIPPQALGVDFRSQTNLPSRPLPATFSPQGKQSGFVPQQNGPGRPPRGGHRSSLVSHTRVGSQQPNGIAHHRMSLPQAYEFPQMQNSVGGMSGYPSPYGISADGFNLLKSQIEYYFSIENLCKDIWLRRHMDSLGFVPISVIAAFKRILDITDSMEIIGHACEESAHVEIVINEQRGELIRRGTEWQLFVLPMNERMEFARNDGPADYLPRTRLQLSFMSPWYSPNGFHATAYGGSEDATMRSQHNEEHLHGAGTGNGYVSETPLSATVSEFSPVGFGRRPQPPNHSLAFAGQVNHSMDGAIHDYDNMTSRGAMANGGMHADSSDSKISAATGPDVQVS